MFAFLGLGLLIAFTCLVGSALEPAHSTWREALRGGGMGAAVGIFAPAVVYGRAIRRVVWPDVV